MLRNTKLALRARTQVRLDERSDVEIEIMSVMVDGTSAKCTLSNKGEKKLSIDACELKYRVLKKKKKTTFDEWGYAFTVRGLRGGSKTTRMQDLKRLADSKNEIESALREMTLFDTEMDSKIVRSSSAKRVVFECEAREHTFYYLRIRAWTLRIFIVSLTHIIEMHGR